MIIFDMDYPTVCATHKCFVPCRKDANYCFITQDEDIVEKVRKFQKGESSE